VSIKMHERTALYLAVMDNDQEEAVQLLASSPKLVSVGDVNGNTPLHVAATDGHDVIAELLIQAGADVDARNDSGDTPLHRAAWQGQLKVAEVLVRHRAMLALQNTNKWTPLYSATRATDGCHGVSKLLIQHGATIELNSAIRLQMTDHAKHMLNDLGSRSVSEVALFPSMLLTDAIDYTSNRDLIVDLVALLLKHGADPNGVNYSDETPLLVACRRTKLPIAVFQMLIENGANIDCRQHTSSLPPVAVAEQAGNDEAALLLRSHMNN